MGSLIYRALQPKTTKNPPVVGQSQMIVWFQQECTTQEPWGVSGTGCQTGLRGFGLMLGTLWEGSGKQFYDRVLINLFKEGEITKLKLE